MFHFPAGSPGRPRLIPPGCPRLRRWLAAALALALAAAAGHAASPYVGFEPRQTHPLEQSGTRLLALNSSAGTLSIYDLAGVPPGAVPRLRAEARVGVAPVAVRARTPDEAWVVNEVSDSVSIVDVARGVVMATIPTPDEPADVAFAGGWAFVSCARSNVVRVIDPVARVEVGVIPLLGLAPGSLAVSPDGTRVYVAFLLSGNETTVLPAARAPAPPAPTNPALPSAPDTALIVPTNDPRVRYRVYPHDVAVIDAATRTVRRYLPGAGTNLFAAEVHPASGDLFVLNTEARNLVRFEPNLRGHVVDHRLTRFRGGEGERAIFDLNPGVDYERLPNPAALATALAHPSALVFDGPGDGPATAWIAAFGTDRLARVDLQTGEVLQRVDLRPAGTSARWMRGPRGLARDPTTGLLYVLNKLTDTISIVSPEAGAVRGEFAIGSFDPVPAEIRQGRGFLFDARLSGNGLVSCATCHLDADRDGLAWDLGVPGGSMTFVNGVNEAAHETTPLPRPMHPMKGPMITQTLRNLAGGAPFHWRGDQPTLRSFNATFVTLLGGELLPNEDMAALETYLHSLRHHPNPHRQLDDSFAPRLVGGSPAAGLTKFNLHVNHCAVCHAGPRGSSGNIDDPRLTDSRDSVKVPSLQTVYQRAGFDGNPGGVNVSGFGLNRDGAAGMLPTVHFYELGTLRGQDLKDVTAYLLSFDTGTPPATGQSRTATATTRADPRLLEDVAVLERQVASGTVALVMEGRLEGQSVRLRFHAASGTYRSRAAAAGTDRAALLAALAGDDALTFLALPPGQSGDDSPQP